VKFLEKQKRDVKYFWMDACMSAKIYDTRTPNNTCFHYNPSHCSMTQFMFLIKPQSHSVHMSWTKSPPEKKKRGTLCFSSHVSAFIPSRRPLFPRQRKLNICHYSKLYLQS